MQFVTFMLGGGRYGLSALAVVELVQAVAIVPLPGAPAVVEGVIDVRGTVVPVLDLRARFGLPPKDLEPSDHLVIARAADRPVALRVDQVLELAECEDGEVQECGGGVPSTPHVAGVVRLPDGLCLIHDLQTFLSEAEAQSLDRALSAPVELDRP